MSSVIMDVSIDQLRALPLEKRLEIIEALWDADVERVLAERWPIPPDVIEDSNREFEAHLANPSTSIPWEHVRARLANPEVAREVRLSGDEQAEIDRRLAEHRRNPGAATPVDTFLTNLDRRYG